MKISQLTFILARQSKGMEEKVRKIQYSTFSSNLNYLYLIFSTFQSITLLVTRPLRDCKLANIKQKKVLLAARQVLSRLLIWEPNIPNGEYWAEWVLPILCQVWTSPKMGLKVSVLVGCWQRPTIISHHEEKRKAFIGSLRSQESLECISFVVFSLHYGMTDVAWGGSKVNILQLHLSPRPNGFSSARAGAEGGYHQLSSLRLTSNIEWFNDSIMSLLPSMLNNIFYVSKDEFQFTLLYI